MPATETLDRDTAATPSQTTRQDGPPRHVHVAIVGSGFAGLGMAIRLKQRGIQDFVVLERADDVGGTWRDNHYPGCQCDVPSHLYSFSFAPNPRWTQTYSPQGEILAYLRGCADRFGIRPRIRFACELREARWDDGRWRLDTSTGPVEARVLVLATGPLSAPAVPGLPGLERFEGATMHSGAWDHGHDLTGERVAVIGTGASAIQFVPAIQPRVARLHVFQRTPPWIIPRIRARRAPGDGRASPALGRDQTGDAGGLHDEVQRRLAGTVWTAGGCRSWYLDDSSRNIVQWPGGTRRFRRMMERFDADRYRVTAAV
jgi:cation diffusion facilitator CzcD-associated flavoprotein CzcO